MAAAIHQLQNAANSERRSRTRFPVVVDLRYTLPNYNRQKQSGSGQTVNISSGGVLFLASEPQTLRGRLKLSITWPVDLHPGVGLKLVATGRVVRTDGAYVAVEFIRHDFHTRSLTSAGKESRTYANVPFPSRAAAS